MIMTQSLGKGEWQLGWGGSIPRDELVSKYLRAVPSTVALAIKQAITIPSLKPFEDRMGWGEDPGRWLRGGRGVSPNKTTLIATDLTLTLPLLFSGGTGELQKGCLVRETPAGAVLTPNAVKTDQIQQINKGCRLPCARFRSVSLRLLTCSRP